MRVFDYVPACLAFAFALLGIFTTTKDESRTGLRRTTAAGWFFVILSFLSLLLGVYWTIRSHEELAKRATVGEIARGRIVGGLELLVKPLCGDALGSTDASEVFETLASEQNLSNVGRQRAVKGEETGGLLVATTKRLPYQDFREPYQLYEHYIASGLRLLMDTLGVFGTYLAEEEIIAVSTLLEDGFLNGDYRLPGKITYFELGRLGEQSTGQDSAWNVVGLHYFNAVYEGSAKRAGNLQPAREFLSKAEEAAVVVIERTIPRRNFVPCVVRDDALSEED